VTECAGQIFRVSIEPLLVNCLASFENLHRDVYERSRAASVNAFKSPNEKMDHQSMAVVITDRLSSGIGKTQSEEKVNWQSRRKAAKTMRSESQVAPHARSKSAHNLGSTEAN
jgi:hypothetical protein